MPNQIRQECLSETAHDQHSTEGGKTTTKEELILRSFSLMSLAITFHQTTFHKNPSLCLRLTVLVQSVAFITVLAAHLCVSSSTARRISEY